MSPAAIMPADFSGKWILETSEKFEDYLKVLSKKLLILVGLPFCLRCLVLCAKVMLQGDVTGCKVTNSSNFMLSQSF